MYCIYCTLVVHVQVRLTDSFLDNNTKRGIAPFWCLCHYVGGRVAHAYILYSSCPVTKYPPVLLCLPFTSSWPSRPINTNTNSTTTITTPKKNAPLNLPSLRRNRRYRPPLRLASPRTRPHGASPCAQPAETRHLHPQPQPTNPHRLHYQHPQPRRASPRQRLHRHHARRRFSPNRVQSKHSLHQTTHPLHATQQCNPPTLPSRRTE